MKRRLVGLALAAWGMFGVCPGSGQNAPEASFTTMGQVVVEGRAANYIVHHLPVSSFPQLPASVQNLLNQRGCLIPQTYEAHRPENVVEASLERHGSKDWAVLCSVNGTVSLMVFFGDGAAPTVLATAAETERLESRGADGVLGFDWGIDPASPERVHEAQMGMRHPPARLDHDALADSIVDQSTVYRYYAGSGWKVLDTQE